MIRRLLLAPVVVLVALVATAAAAGAHVDIDPTEAVAGSTTTLTFSFHHGKDGSATTGLEVLLPPGATAVEAPEVPGWTAEIDPDAGTVSWTGGPVPDGTKAELPLVVTLPAEPGEVLFKTIQTTEAGELAWIEETDDDAEGTYPAPRLTLVPDPDASATTQSTTSTTEATSDTTERLPLTTLEAEERDDGSSSAAPWLIGSGIAAAVAVGAGGLWLRRRNV